MNLNINAALWAVPTVAFALAFVAIARQIRVAASRGLSYETVSVPQPRALEADELPMLFGGAETEMESGPELPSSPRPAPRWTGSQKAEEPGFDPLSRENFSRLASTFGIREISILPLAVKVPGYEPNAKFLVEFGPEVEIDYRIIFGLRQELFNLIGRRVELTCRNTADPRILQEAFAEARVLYAA